MTEQKDHCRYAPSSAERWTSCTASLDLIDSLNLPEQTSSYAAEGQRLHELMHQRLLGNPPPKDITKDEIETVRSAMQLSEPFRKSFDDIELEMEVSQNLAGQNVYGTVDFLGYSAEDKELLVLDWKFGRGIAVNAKKNKQLVIYANLAASMMMEVGAVIDKVLMVIIQPRIPKTHGPSSSCWVLSTSELQGEMLEIKDAIQNIVNKDVEYKPTPDNCRFCPAKMHCPEIAKAVIKSEQDIRTISEGREVAIEELARLRAVCDLAVQAKKILDARAFEYMNQGGKIEGLRLRKGRAGARKWNGNDAKIKTLLREAGLKDDDMATEPKLKSPAQIEKTNKAAYRNVAPFVVQDEAKDVVDYEPAFVESFALPSKDDLAQKFKALEVKK